jgi:hypothetical protein
VARGVDLAAGRRRVARRYRQPASASASSDGAIQRPEDGIGAALDDVAMRMVIFVEPRRIADRRKPTA